MKALLCERPGSLVLVDRDLPVPEAGDVLIRIRRIGVCGTDYHIFHGRQPYLDYPRVMGHELAGEVVSAPPGSDLASGQIVCVQPYIYCGTCLACRRGKTNCCQRLGVLGVHRDGGMTELLAVPARNVIAVDGLTFDQAAMVEFLAIGAHGIRRAGVTDGQRVLVAGAGPIGMAAAIFARARGGGVTVVDMNEGRLAFCRDQLHVEATFKVGPDLGAELGQATDGDFFDVVVDATGSAAAMSEGFAYVAHGGAYVLLSIVRSAITFDDPEFHKRETTLLASRNATRADFMDVLDTMRAGAVPTTALATHRASLIDAATLISTWSQPDAGVIKALIEV